MTTTPTPTSGAADLASRLRNACTSVRSKSYPLDDLIPLMQQAADALAYTPAQPVAEPAKADSVLEDALSDAVRVPLDSLHADAAYLIGRLREGSMPYARVIGIIRERIDAAKAAIRARASHGQAPASVLHLVHSAFAEIAMAFPKAFALHKVGIADTAVREALAAPATQQAGEVRPVTPYTCPKCHALWLHWPAEQTGFGRDTLNCRSADHCHYCEKAGVEQLQRLERISAALHAPQPSPTVQPAPATQQAGERVYAFRRKGLADFCTCDEARYEELSNKPHLFETRVFYTTPQPVARESLSAAQKQHIHNETGAGHALICLVERYLLDAHGIKGGQHG